MQPIRPVSIGASDLRGQVWVTRTQPGAGATAERLTERGYAALVSPVLEVRALAEAALTLDGVDVLAFTSANGVRAFAEQSGRRDLAAFCVGAGTAETARSLGLQAFSADGDVGDLAALLTRSVAAGAIVGHPCAVEVAGDLASALSAVKLSLRAMPLYETVGVPTLPAQVRDRLRDGRLDTVLVHSPKAARILTALLSGEARLTDLRALAISARAAEPLAALPFASVRTAAAPQEQALLALLDP